MALTKSDLKAISLVVDQSITTKVPQIIDERVPGMITKAINESVPQIIDERVPRIIQKLVPQIIDERVPGMITKAINESVPQIIDESIDRKVPGMISAAIQEAAFDLGQRIDEYLETINKRIALLPTRDEYFEIESKIMRELKDLRDEVTSTGYRSTSNSDRLDNHEKRIKKLETHVMN